MCVWGGGASDTDVSTAATTTKYYCYHYQLYLAYCPTALKDHIKMKRINCSYTYDDYYYYYYYTTSTTTTTTVN